jgi:hypothetical protein
MLKAINDGARYIVLQGFHHWFSHGLLEIGFTSVKGVFDTGEGGE